MHARLKKYLIFHGILLALAAGFGIYALLMRRFFPEGYFHCVLHDLLHLYCPFCGGTRAFLSLLRFDILTALRLNAALLFAGLAFILFDLRALWLICRKSEAPLLPPRLGSIAILYFGAYMLVINTLMLYGIDPAGDLAPYWQQEETTIARALFAPLFALMLFLFAFATDALHLSRLDRHRAAMAWACGYLAVALLFCLYLKWQFLLLCIPLTAGAILHTRIK